MNFFLAMQNFIKKRLLAKFRDVVHHKGMLMKEQKENVVITSHSYL